jgi:beta-xylosidase
MEENVRPPNLWVARLSNDLLSLDSELVECITADQDWEHDWVEGPFVIRHKDWYYMTYSGFGYSSPDYAVGYATATSPFGPWTKYEHNPILRRTGAVSGPGHNSIVASPDGSELFMAYHRHVSFNGGGQRALAIDRIQFLENGTEPPLLAVDGPTHVHRPFPSGAPPHLRAASDEFNATSLDRSRWMILGEDDQHWCLRNGALEIETQNGDLWTDRTDARNVFLQYAPEGDFAVECRLDFAPEANYEQAFLVIFQDQSNYLRLATVHADGPRLEVAREVNGRYESVTLENTVRKAVELRIVKTGTHYAFQVRDAAEKDGNRQEASWIPAGDGFTADWPQLKIGLGAASPGSGAQRTARFQYFRLTAR